MEMCHSLLLNEEAYAQIPEQQKQLFVYEWLRFLSNVLPAAQKADIKECQKKLVDQLLTQISTNPGPPIRQLIGQCLATLFSVGDAFLLFDSINKCNDLLKNKDDSPSFLPTRLAALTCLGYLYEKLGRMAGRSYEETVQVVLRGLRNAESQMRTESMITLGKLCQGMGNAASNLHRDIHKACKLCLADRNMSVRAAAAKCLWQVLQHSSAPQLNDIESVTALCFRALEGSNYEVRCAVSHLLGYTAAAALNAPKTPQGKSAASAGSPQVSIADVLSVLSTGFLRGSGGFLKGTGEMIKGPAAISREVRVGVTMSYVVMIQQLGASWLERNLSLVLQHILELASQPRAAPTHVDAVYSRQCVSFVLRSLLGKLLGEKQQATACKELAAIINKHMNSIDPNPENAKESSTQETVFSQHLLVCALQELASLIRGLGSTATALLADQSAGVIDCALAVLLHPSQAARLAAAWCLQAMAVAVPCHLTPLIDKCVDALENLRSTPEAVSGYSAALAALLGGVSSTPLGIPHNRGKIVFNTAEELLRSASQNNRLALQRTQAGWLLIGAVMTLGVPVVSGLVPRMLLLWRNSFPRSAKELESEKARGDAFTWQVSLEGRAGALSAIHSFLRHCPQLATSEDVLRRVMGPLDAAITMLTNIVPIVKAYGQPLKAACAMVRMRLYDSLSLVPAQYYEGSCTQLLRLLVAEFTLAENPANTTTSLLPLFCHPDDAAALLNPGILDSDYGELQQQLQPNSAAGSGALEHDSCYLYRQQTNGQTSSTWIPGPLPLGVAIIDSAISLFGHVFPAVVHKHRMQLLTHFDESFKQSKSGRLEAVQTNVCAALLAALRSAVESKSGLGNGAEEFRKGVLPLAQALLASSSSVLRSAAAETIGRVAQLAADSRFTNETSQNSFEKLKSSRDAASRTGHSLTLGCLHRYGGGLGMTSSQQLSSSVSILIALAQDTSSAIVQVWALQALTTIAEASGPMFRPYVDACLKMSVQLLLTSPTCNADVQCAAGRCSAALVTVFGPELHGNTGSITAARSSLLSACALLQQHPNSMVQAQAILCLQQLHLFAPRHVNLSSLVPILCRALSSSYLGLRRAAVSCLRQLAQREAREVFSHAAACASDPEAPKLLQNNELGLPAALFALLDSETDPVLLRNLRDTLIELLTSLAEVQLSSWLLLCKEALTVTADASLDAQQPKGLASSEGKGEDGPEAADDDEEEFRAVGEETGGPMKRPGGAPPPRWPTRVFAAQCVCKLLVLLRETNVPAHFDLSLARELRNNSVGKKGEHLVLFLPDLIRLAFIAATSDCDSLRMEGLHLLQLLIDSFARQQEPEFPGHSILEQYQAQVSAALRPAFSSDTAPNVTAVACEVCSTWMCCGVAKDIADLRRVQQLLLSALTRISTSHHSLGGGSIIQQNRLYNESTASLEKLTILKAWAEVYVTAMQNSTTPSSDENAVELLPLVKTELVSLSTYWLAALKDHALLTLPSDFGSQLPPEGGAFYMHETLEASRPYYKKCWAPVMQAAALWLGHAYSSHQNNEEPDNSFSNYFYLVFGIALEALCDPKSTEPETSTTACLAALEALLESSKARAILAAQPALQVELCNVLHRVLLTKESKNIHKLSLSVLRSLLKVAQEELETQRSQDSSCGEGGPEGELLPGKSLVFAAMEVCLCLLVKYLPGMDPSRNPAVQIWASPLSSAASELVASGLDLISQLPSLCSPQGALAILPPLLHIVTSCLKELGTSLDSPSIASALHCLRSFATNPHRARTEDNQWDRLLQSCMGRLLDWGKAGEDDQERLDPAVLLNAVTELMLYSPPGLYACPVLLYPSLNAFQQAVQSPSPLLRLESVKLFCKLLESGSRDVLVPLIHAMAPKLFTYLCSPAARQPESDQQLLFIVESLSCVEALAKLADPEHCVLVLQLLVPILIGCLLDTPQMKAANQSTRLLHSHALQTLTRIGTQYPQEFKLLLGRLPDLRTKLESAARASQSQNFGKPGLSKAAEAAKQAAAASAAPAIKLKTDFSNFGK